MFTFKLLSSHLLIFFICIRNNLALRGSALLDSFTFDKVLSHFPVTLVKFDIQYPYGNIEDEYAQVVDSLKNKENLLVAEVGVQDYADYENQDLAGRYSLKKNDFPVVKLYTQDNLKSPATFPATEKFKASNIMRFVKKNTIIRIVLDKCLQDFDDLAETFMAPGATKAMKERLLNEAKKRSKSLSGEEKESADVYVKIMEKVLEKGDNFVASEEERVKNVISESVPREKKQEMEVKLNILCSFITSNNPKKAKTEL